MVLLVEGEVEEDEEGERREVGEGEPSEVEEGVEEGEVPPLLEDLVDPSQVFLVVSLVFPRSPHSKPRLPRRSVVLPSQAAPRSPSSPPLQQPLAWFPLLLKSAAPFLLPPDLPPPPPHLPRSLSVLPTPPLLNSSAPPLLLLRLLTTPSSPTTLSNTLPHTLSSSSILPPLLPKLKATSTLAFSAPTEVLPLSSSRAMVHQLSTVLMERRLSSSSSTGRASREERTASKAIRVSSHRRDREVLMEGRRLNRGKVKVRVRVAGESGWR